MSNWKLISNHGVVLAYIAKNPEALGIDVGAAIGIRERTVRRIIADLKIEGYLITKRVGRRNRYKVNLKAPLRRSVMRKGKVGDLLKVLLPLFEIGE